MKTTFHILLATLMIVLFASCSDLNPEPEYRFDHSYHYTDGYDVGHSESSNISTTSPGIRRTALELVKVSETEARIFAEYQDTNGQNSRVDVTNDVMIKNIPAGLDVIKVYLGADACVIRITTTDAGTKNFTVAHLDNEMTVTVYDKKIVFPL